MKLKLPQGKHIAAIAVAVLLTCLLLQHTGNNRRIDSYQYKIDSLTQCVESRDNIIVQMDSNALKLTFKADSLQGKVNTLKKTNSVLEGKLDSISSIVDSIPSDVNYAYLTDVAYPFKGKEEFNFNENQIKEIRVDFEENILLSKIKLNLDSTLKEMDMMLWYKDSLINMKDYQLGLLKLNQIDLKSLIELNKSEIVYWKAEADRQRKLKIKFGAGSTVLGVLLIIALL